MKTQKELAEQIGVTDRTIRRMSPRKRKQWAVLAAQGRDVAWFDLLAQLCFEVDAFNMSNEYEWFWLQIDARVLTLSRFSTLSSTAISTWSCVDSEKLAAALEYVRSLS